jgi:hypothetical protein
MIYAYPTWEFAADTQLLTLQHLQNKVLCTTGKFSKRTPVRELHMAFRVPYIYNYITKLCRQQAKVIQNHENGNVATSVKVKLETENIKRLKLGDGRAYDYSSD